MQKTPYGLRTHIGIIGRRNSGKSSLLNAITHQQISIVSDEPGTTTDPVLKSMELLPLGPVVFYDTAGLDDIGNLGEKRVRKTITIIDRLDIALLVVVANQWSKFEEDLIYRFKESETPLIVVFNKIDLSQPGAKLLTWLEQNHIESVKTDANILQGIDDLRQVVIRVAQTALDLPSTIAGDLVFPGEIAILVTPIDSEAPRGRLILPQVQVIRDLLNHNVGSFVVKENGFKQALNQLTTRPRIVITDSQVFKRIARETPPEILLTSFSILFARFKGDLQTFVDGLRIINSLMPGDKVLIAEGCTHHPLENDIGTVKIPKWLNERIDGKLNFIHKHGTDFPTEKELREFKLVIHCGACNFNRKQMLARIDRCRTADVPITNYGLVISKVLNILDRALEPFDVNQP